jgi:hypothetical protein
VACAKCNGGRQVRIIYVSDFDPGGMSMPLAEARKIEWFLRNLDSSLDIQLQPVVLTHEQCAEYRLPRTPIKESERRAGRFEDRFGAGATELDVFEALYSGQLRKILVRTIERFHDPSLQQRWIDARQNTQNALDEIARDVLGERADERAAIRVQFEELRDESDALEKKKPRP